MASPKLLSLKWQRERLFSPNGSPHIGTAVTITFPNELPNPSGPPGVHKKPWKTKMKSSQRREIELHVTEMPHTVRMILIVPLFSLPMKTETAEGTEDAMLSWPLLLQFWESYIFDWEKGFSLLGSPIYQLLEVYIQRWSHQLILCALLPFSWQWKMRAQHTLFASIKQLFKNKVQAWICQRDNANSTGSMTSLWLRVEVKSIHSLTSLQILTYPLIADDPLTDCTSIGNVWLLSLQLCISNRQQM